MKKWYGLMKQNIVLLAVALLLNLGLAGSTAQAAPADFPVGVVDMLYLINNHPDTAKANEALKAESDRLLKEFQAKSAGMSAKDKQALDQQLGRQIEQKRQELLKPIAESVGEAMKAVAAEKGLVLLVHKNSVALGGNDITADVLQKLQTP